MNEGVNARINMSAALLIHVSNKLQGISETMDENSLSGKLETEVKALENVVVGLRRLLKQLKENPE